MTARHLKLGEETFVLIQDGARLVLADQIPGAEILCDTVEDRSWARRGSKIVRVVVPHDAICVEVRVVCDVPKRRAWLADGTRCGVTSVRAADDSAWVTRVTRPTGEVVEFT